MGDQINKVKDILAKHTENKNKPAETKKEVQSTDSKPTFFGKQKENGDIRLEFDVESPADTDVKKEADLVLENVAKGTIIATAPAKPTGLAQISSSSE